LCENETSKLTFLKEVSMNEKQFSEVRADVAALREDLIREIRDLKAIFYNLQPRVGGAATDLGASVAQIAAPASGRAATDLGASVAQIAAPATKKSGKK
jgi:hypothetical protein